MCPNMSIRGLLFQRVGLVLSGVTVKRVIHSRQIINYLTSNEQYVSHILTRTSLYFPCKDRGFYQTRGTHRCPVRRVNRVFASSPTRSWCTIRGFYTDLRSHENFFSKTAIEVNPLYVPSPDLNAIEHLWDKIFR